MTDDDFPVADVAPAKSEWLKQMSRMWIVTVGCVILAIGLVWYSLESPGPRIVIRFAQGHGLKAGDPIRHRGIEIGVVEHVRLSETLEGIEVTAVLDADAAAIAREGSRFWIVRPQLDLTGVSGLETAVGSKYIAVAPGRSTTQQNVFDGLASQPPDGIALDGIEIIVRGDQRYGVNPGSPVSWRGVKVGQVLSSSLSPDAMHVDTRVRIMEPHRRLLSRQSKFWVTSGVHMGLDVVGGFEFSAESIAEIARGGIAFITPAPGANSQPVKPGDVFTLHEQKDDKWFDSVIGLNLMQLPPPPVAVVAAQWRQTHFGIPRTYQSHASALTVKRGDGATAVLMPADLARAHADAVDGSQELTYIWEDHHVTLPVEPTGATAAAIAKVVLPPAAVIASSLLTTNRIRLPQGPEDCFAIRRSWHSEQDSAVVIEMIGKEQLSLEEGVWRCDNEKLSRDVWHGAAVVASVDENVIGMIVVVDHKPMIIQLTPELTDR